MYYIYKNQFGDNYSIYEPKQYIKMFTSETIPPRPTQDSIMQVDYDNEVINWYTPPPPTVSEQRATAYSVWTEYENGEPYYSYNGELHTCDMLKEKALNNIGKPFYSEILTALENAILDVDTRLPFEEEVPIATIGTGESPVAEL